MSGLLLLLWVGLDRTLVPRSSAHVAQWQPIRFVMAIFGRRLLASAYALSMIHGWGNADRTQEKYVRSDLGRWRLSREAQVRAKEVTAATPTRRAAQRGRPRSEIALSPPPMGSVRGDNVTEAPKTPWFSWCHFHGAY